MGLFNFSKSKKESVSKKSDLDITSKDEITGSLFYLMFNIKSLRINVVGKNDDYACKISKIDDKKSLFYLTILGRAAISKSDTVSLKYDIAEIRYSLKTEAKKNNSDYDLCLEYPDVIRHFERRKNQRVIFRRNENIDIKLITDLFSGYAAIGRISNLGMGGYCCSINKIIKVTSGKDIPINPLTFKPSTNLAIIKFLLPGYGDLEVGGKTVHVNQVGYNLNVGGAFYKLPNPQKNILERFTSQRGYTPVPPDFLAFYRKFNEEKNNSDNETIKVNKPVEDDNNQRDYSKVVEEETHTPKEEEESLILAREDEEVYKRAEKKAEATAIEKGAAERHEAVLQRDEAILLVLFDSEEIGLVRKILNFNGFSNSTLATNYTEALKLMTEKRFNLIILDYDLHGQVNAEQFIRTLKNHPTLRDLPISIIVDSLNPSKQARIISLKVSRISIRPLKESDVVDTLTKTLGID